MNGLLDTLLAALSRFPKVILLLIGLLVGGFITRNSIATIKSDSRITELEQRTAAAETALNSAKGGAEASAAGRQILAEIAALRQRFEEETTRINHRLDRIEATLDQVRNRRP